MIDPSGVGEAALAVSDAQALGDVAEHVDSAGLAGDGGIDKVEGGVQAATAWSRVRVMVETVEALTVSPRSSARVRPTRLRGISRSGMVPQVVVRLRW